MVWLRVGLGPALKVVVVEVICGLLLKRVQFMSLLETALRNQVLRQAGAVYQFRHAALQDLLATHDASILAAERPPRSASESTLPVPEQSNPSNVTER